MPPRRGRSRDDAWELTRDAIDLVDVVTRCLGPPPGRRGGRGDRRWWACPFHEDKNPSFCVRPDKRRWHCFGCGSSGDSVDFVRGLNPGMTFPEIKSFLTGGDGLTVRAVRRASPKRAEPEISPEVWQASAREIVAGAVARLWGPDGAEGLAYLRGRCLADETIRSASLGLTTRGLEGVAEGLAIPWQDGGTILMVNVRRPLGSDPKYMAMAGSRRKGTIYPGRPTIRPGRPLIVTEGEFDALLLGQELGELAAVVTLGSAGMKPDAAILGALLAASRWCIATDNDPAGDGAATVWPASARRVPPPARYKDWTEAAQDGVNLRRWWAEILGGIEAPELFTNEEAAAWRWGPSCDDPSPAIVVGRPEVRTVPEAFV